MATKLPLEQITVQVKKSKDTRKGSLIKQRQITFSGSTARPQEKLE